MGSVVAYPLGGDDECCSDPGKIAECWQKDAEDDGVTCEVNGDCPSGTCGDNRLCTCTKPEHCNDGVKLFGICNEADGFCGPSFCNGVIKCSCFGGCAPEDLGPYANPQEKCEDTAHGYPGFCCEGAYPRSPEGTYEGFCSHDPSCNQGCNNDAECDDGNPCTNDQCINDGCVNANLPNGTSCAGSGTLPADLSADCAAFQCDSGECLLANLADGVECTDNVLPPGAPPSWHDDCWLNACSTGQCRLAQRAEDFPCDDGNDCSSISKCTADALCAATDPNDPPTGECCDPAVPDSYEDGSTCTTDWCDGTYHDQSLDKPEYTVCTVPTDTDDTCGQWLCDDSGSCEETTEPFEGLDCHSAATGGPGPGGDLSFCAKYVCSEEDGDEGDCVPAPRNEGVGCDWVNPPDTCGPKTCQAGVCDFSVTVGTTPCVPASGTADSCCDWECNAAHTCVATTCSGGDEDLDDCPGEWMGTLSSAIGATLSVSESNKCAADDYDVDTTGIFGACSVVDEAENVHRFDEVVHPSQYQLRHTEVEVTSGAAWDAVVFVSETCDDTGVGPDVQSGQHTCDFGTVVTSGPWPLVDQPNSGASEGYTVEDTHSTYVFVDSRNTSSPPGGAYDLDLEVVPHDNSDCQNTADEVVAPRIRGGSAWKSRFRGNVTDYDNYFDEVGVNLATQSYCWTGGAPDDADPSTAFFRVELEDGIDTLSTGTLEWDRTYKIYTDPGATGEMSNVLSWWGANPPDGNCDGSLLGGMVSCKNPPDNGPREFVVEKGDALRKGWLALSNAADNVEGNYEVNVVRVPRPFLGMQQFFVGSGSGLGCGCDPPANTYTTFSLAGQRLDFTPTNDDVSGFAVRRSDQGDDWLAEPAGQKMCAGVGCKNWGSTTPTDIGFQFPYAGKLWSKFCVDSAGRVELAQKDTDCSNRYVNAPNTVEFYETGAPAIVPLWGSIVPCHEMDQPDCGFFGWKSNGDLVCAQGVCVFGAGSCDMWQWNDSTCASDGYILKNLTTFEGTTARVITWVDFNGKNQPRSGSLSFQVILRVDGRVTIFYKEGSDGGGGWGDILDANGWLVGASGGRAHACTTDTQCNDHFGSFGLVCDTGGDTELMGIKVWTPKDRCMNLANFQQAGSVQVGGTWQGE